MYQIMRNIYKTNKEALLFRSLEKYKTRYNNWFWSERKVTKLSLRHKQGKTYYVIRRYAASMGIGSYILSNLSHIKYAIENGYIPVIDMLHYNSTNVDNKEFNTWELYFEQPVECSLGDAYRSKEYILSSGDPKKNIPNESIGFLNSKEFNEWQSLFKKYIVFNQKMKKYCDDEYDSLLKNKNVLGVLCRGTDYFALKPKGHPIQPQIGQIMDSIEIALDSNKYECIYLATEDELIRDHIKSKYGEMLIENKRAYKKYEEGYIANTSNNRNNDAYLTNREYLSSLNLLSKCNGIIAGRTSGLVIALLLNSEYNYKYIWNLGNYD